MSHKPSTNSTNTKRHRTHSRLHTFVTYLAVLILAMCIQKFGSFDLAEALVKSKCVNLTETLIYQSTDKKNVGQVTELQKFLQDRGYLATKPDGFFGFTTITALKKYQLKSKIPDAGYLDFRTRKKIQADTCSVSEIKKIDQLLQGPPKATSTVIRIVRENIVSKSGGQKVTNTVLQLKDEAGNVIGSKLSTQKEGSTYNPGDQTTVTSKTESGSTVIFNSSPDLSAPIIILAPTSTEAVKAGSKYQIKWSAKGILSNSDVRIALVNTKTEEILKIPRVSLEDTGTLDLSKIDVKARGLKKSLSGIAETTPNTGTYTWNVPKTVPLGVGYKIFIGDPGGGIGGLGSTTFAIKTLAPKINTVRLLKVAGGFLVNVSGEDFSKGLSVKFDYSNRTVFGLNSDLVQVFGQNEVQFFMKREDMTGVLTGTSYVMTLYNNESQSNEKIVLLQ